MTYWPSLGVYVVVKRDNDQTYDTHFCCMYKHQLKAAST